jgi:hypothetical protein
VKRCRAGLIAVALHCTAFAGTTDANLYGRWKVTGVAGAQNTTSLSSDEIDKLKGDEFVIDAQTIRFAGEECAHPQMTKSIHSTESFFRREYKISPKGLNLPDPVTEFEVACDAPSPISYIYVRDGKVIVFFWNGFFLNATRQALETDR